MTRPRRHPWNGAERRHSAVAHISAVEAAIAVDMRTSRRSSPSTVSWNNSGRAEVWITSSSAYKWSADVMFTTTPDASCSIVTCAVAVGAFIQSNITVNERVSQPASQPGTRAESAGRASATSKAFHSCQQVQLLGSVGARTGNCSAPVTQSKLHGGMS